MATETFEALRAAALELPAAERADLAHDLVKSLDAAPEADAAAAWETELLARLNEIDAGTASLIDRSELRQRIQARLGKPQ